MQRQYFDANDFERNYFERGFYTRWDRSDEHASLSAPSGTNASTYRWVSGDKTGTALDRLTATQLYTMVENLYRDKQPEDALGDFRPGVDFNSAYSPSYSNFMKAGESWANWDFWPKTIEKIDTDSDGVPDTYLTIDTESFIILDNAGQFDVRDKDTSV